MLSSSDEFRFVAETILQIVHYFTWLFYMIISSVKVASFIESPHNSDRNEMSADCPQNMAFCQDAP